MLYLIVQCFFTLKRDVELKVEENQASLFYNLCSLAAFRDAKNSSSLGILIEISQCSRQYIENRCKPGERVPAMEKACVLWEKFVSCVLVL